MPIDFDALKIRQPLDLGEYHEALKGQSLDVWVNLSRIVLDSIKQEMTPDELRALYCHIWSISANEYDEFKEACDPYLWAWIVKRTQEMILSYQDERKNAGAA